MAVAGNDCGLIRGIMTAFTWKDYWKSQKSITTAYLSTEFDPSAVGMYCR
jgi:hypothetical protein